jgi:hypothetical protein
MIRNSNFTHIFDKFKSVIYDDTTHSYTLDGNKLENVTTYLTNKYLKPFDKWKIASILATTTDKPSHYWIDYWKLTGDEASIVGSRVHLFASWYSNKSKPKDKLEEAVRDFYEDHLKDGWTIVCTELCVHNDKLAGRFDLLMYKPQEGYWLLDFKTTKKDLIKDTKELKNGGSITLIDFYGMQLKCYEYLLGLDTIKKSVVHIKESGYTLFDIV